MARFLAIDWSRHEARYVLASAKAGVLKVEAAEALPLATSDDTGEPDSRNAGAALKSAIAAHKVGRTQTLVGVDRASIELHHLTLPPASDGELPLLVANQIARDSRSMSGESVLDFVTESIDPNQPLEVTAAILAESQLNAIRATCSEAGLSAHRILVRPYASAALFLGERSSQTDSCLLVNFVDDEVDLTIVNNGQITFSRTVRVPESAAGRESHERLVAEIPRTLMVAPHTTEEPGAVGSVCIFGKADDHQPLVDLIESTLNLQAETFDPFEAVGDFSQLIPDRTGRFASLLGMIAVEAGDQKHAIDFLHPRKPPEKRDYRRPLSMVAGIAAVSLIAFGYSVWDDLSLDDDRIANLKSELNDVERELDQAEEHKLVADSIANWQAGDVTWIDELRDLSLRLPGSRDLMVLRMSMSPARGGGGVVTFQGLARESTVVDRMIQSIRDDYHEIRVPHEQGRAPDDAYSWHFDTSISVTRRDKAAYNSGLAEQGKAGTSVSEQSPESPSNAGGKR